MTATPPLIITPKTRTLGALGVAGPADTLRVAFETGQPITLDGKFAGERVYLGHRRQTVANDAVAVETLGLDHTVGQTPKFPGVEIAVYLVDTTRLDQAPSLAAAHQRASATRFANAVRVHAAADAEEQRLSDPDRI